MEKLQTLKFMTAIAAIAFGASAGAATITNSLTAPIVDGDDIANLAAATGSASVWSDRPVQGQTFTSSATGGDLNSITVQIFESAANAPINGWKDYQLRFGTMDLTPSAEAINVAVVTVDRYDPDADADSYLTFTFDTPISLTASTVYGFDLGVEASQAGWQAGIPAVRTTGDEYAGGQRIQGSRPNQIDNITGQPNGVSLTGGDLVFHLDIVPEPSSLALLAMGGLVVARRRRK